jgi:hypothetical protein
LGSFAVNASCYPSSGFFTFKPDEEQSNQHPWGSQ